MSDEIARIMKFENDLSAVRQHVGAKDPATGKKIDRAQPFGGIDEQGAGRRVLRAPWLLDASQLCFGERIEFRQFAERAFAAPRLVIDLVETSSATRLGLPVYWEKKRCLLLTNTGER